MRTVPVELWPPSSVLGVRTRLSNVGASTCSVTVWLDAPNLAVMETFVSTATTLVVTGNCRTFVPAAMFTIAGTWTTALLPLVTCTLAPPAGAGMLIATVPVVVVPPTTLNEFNVSNVSLGARTRRIAETVLPAGIVAVMRALVSTATAVVVIAKVFVVVFWPMLTDPGTIAAPESLLRPITKPPAGAGAASVIRPVEKPGPPLTTLGFRVSVAVIGFTNRLVVAVRPLASLTEMLTDVLTATCFVVTTNWVDVWPALIFAVAGTVATAVLLLVSVKFVPAAGAGALITAVASGFCTPPIAEVGLTVT